MENFPSWLTENRIPSPVNPNQFSFNLEGSRYNLSGMFWNQNVPYGISWSYANVTDVRISSGSFFIEQYVGVETAGEYHIEGNYLTDLNILKAVNSTGNYTAYMDCLVRLRVNGFQINNDGFIDLSPANITNLVKVTFQGIRLVHDGDENDPEYSVVRAMNCLMDSQGGKQQIFPIGEFAQEYFTEILAVTPIDDMAKANKSLMTINDVQDRQISEEDPDAFLHLIINSVMQRFWEWILESNLDPTPVDPKEFKFVVEGQNMNISGKFWNQFSNGHGFSTGSYEIHNVSVTRGSFGIDLRHEKLMLAGNYAVEGTFPNQVHVQSEGKFSSLALYYIMSHIFVEGFEINSKGYLDLSTATVSYQQAVTLTNFKLVGLDKDVDDAGIREEIEIVLSCVYEKQADFVTVFPVGRIAIQYLQQYFDRQPIGDWLNRTMPTLA